MSLRIRASRLTVPKRGRKPEENEDRYNANSETLRFAIADGATESSFARQWAKLLVDHFMKDASIIEHHRWGEWLPPIQKQWQADVAGRDIPWYAQDKAEQGAFASFLGLVLKRDRTWQAIAVGDCSLLQFRENVLIRLFPFQDSAKFSTTPWLLGSTHIPDAAFQEENEFRMNKAEAQKNDLILPTSWQACDEFLLVTDALGKWFVRFYQEQLDRSEVCTDTFPRTQPEFDAFVDERRKSGELDNDDTTILRISLIASDKSPTPQPTQQQQSQQKGKKTK